MVKIAFAEIRISRAAAASRNNGIFRASAKA
jgi:hypothetical protein